MIFKQLPSVQQVVAGSTATAGIPVGPTYHKLVLEYAGVTLAQLENIRLNVNGKAIQEFATGTILKAINDYYGRQDNTASGLIEIYLSRPEPISLVHQRMTALGTADVATVDLQIDINAGAAAPVLKLHAETSAAQKLGMIYKVKSFPGSSATSGQFDIDSLPRPMAHNIMALHFGKADVNDVEIDRDSVRVYDASKTVGHANLAAKGRVAQTGYTHVEFGADGHPGEGMPVAGVQDLRFRLTLGTSGSVATIVEYMGPFAGI